MKVISFEDINSMNISPVLCYEWVSEMIEHKQEEFLPEKTHMNMPGGVFCNVMPCLIHNTDGTMGGVKVVTRYPERKPSLDSKIMLFNAESGDFLALMDGNWITAMRTGAVAAHSIMNFAKKEYDIIGMIGLGNVARSTLLVLASKVPNKKLTIKLLRYKDQADLFIERFKKYTNLRFIIVDTLEECIKGSDVVVSCATYFESDIAKDEWFDKGVLVVPIHTRGFTNCDLFFDKVLADDTGHVKHFKNFQKFRYFAEVSDVINGKSVGRENDDERILAYNIGVSIHDINYATHIYNILKKDTDAFNYLGEVDMKDPREKFWV